MRQHLSNTSREALRTIKAEYRADAPPDLQLHRPVSRAFLKKSRYFTTNLIQTGRGCPYQCDFCNVYTCARFWFSFMLRTRL